MSRTRTRLRAPRILACVALAGAALFATSLASAGENGTIVLTDGSSIAGEIIEMVQGDHLALRLPNGEIRTVQWAQLASLQVGASGSVVIGPGTPAPPPPQPIPPPAPVVETPPPPPPPPPPVVYAPPPPQVTPTYYAAPPPPPPERFMPRWSFGGRIGPMWTGSGKNGQLIGATHDGADGNNTPESSYVSSGVALEGDIGYHFSPAWTFYGFWEHGFLGRGDVNGGAQGNTSSDFVGLGFNANTNPHGPLGFYFDVAAGWRWLSVYAPSAGGTPSITNASPNGDGSGPESRFTFSGFEPLRIGIGASIVVDPTFRLDLVVANSVGYFSHVEGDATCPVTNDGTACGTIPSERRALHSFWSFTVAGHWDLQ
jgi:hypothetical protein